MLQKNERIITASELFNAVISSGLGSLRAIVFEIQVNIGRYERGCLNHYKVVKMVGAVRRFAFISF